jgi:hypothetical protein
MLLQCVDTEIAKKAEEHADDAAETYDRAE